MKTRAQLILATVGLTLLIWVYADLTSQESHEATLTIKLVVPLGSDSVIQIVGQDSTTEPGFDTSAAVPVQVTLAGPKAAIADLEHLRRSEGLVIEVPVPIGEGGGSDVLRTVDIREQVARWARERSLRVVDLSRQFVGYKLDHYVKIDLTVEATAGVFADKLQGPPRVEPPQVKARLLASQRDRYAGADRKLEVSIEQQLRTGSEDTLDVPLAGLRWQGLEVTYIPDRVAVSVVRQHEFITHRITAIPLYELWPAYRPEAGNYRIEWEDREPPLQHIEVMVPPGKPRLPDNKDVIAYVTIEPDDLKQATQDKIAAETAPAGTRAGILREVRFIFAEGFEDVRAIGPRPTVRFRVVRTDTPPAAP